MPFNKYISTKAKYKTKHSSYCSERKTQSANKCIRNSMERNEVLVMVYTVLFCFMPLLSRQNNITIAQNQHIQNDETLVSEGGTFEAGFFSFGNSQRQYFGIWYKNISPRTIVWVANRDAPVESSTATLKLTDQGNLLILDGSKGIVWSSNTSRTAAEKLFMQLLDSGNLVVKDGDNLIWESFDYLGDTFLAGMKIKSNLLSGPYRFLTSWRNTEDPAVGEFSYRIDTRGFPQLVVTKGATVTVRAGPWTGHMFAVASWLRIQKTLKFSFQFSGQEISYEYETLNRSIITRMVLNPSGTAQRWIWSDQTQSWEIISNYPVDQCEYYAFCGANSKCNAANNPICECLEGFTPKFQGKWKSLDWTGGCVPKKNLSCQNGDGFLKYTGVTLPDTSSSWFVMNKSLDECETLCLQNCSCTAYAYLDNYVGRRVCLIWLGDIVDLKKHPDQGQEIYIRVAALELDHRRNKRNFNTKKLAGIVVGIIIFIICITILGLVTFICIQRKKNERPGDSVTRTINHWKDKRGDEDIDWATIFDFSTISNTTNHFSESNKLGEGGFGPVYKGLLADGQEIAVKRLSNTSGQGVEEFKNEAMLIARLQHRNLVKLLGCSIHQDEKLLIYEFMHNGSLDYFIFDSTRRKLLDWNMRFQIIDGIARGLLYLHRDSRLRIIHRDLKTSNILLDDEMNPKISDFGLARTLIGDQIEAQTKRVMGTYGYMSPEYAVHGFFSIKSDVFSFGVIVLEIISGKKMRRFRDPHHHLNLLGHAWRLWIEERALELIDEIDSVIPSEILRYIHVGLLCVQQKPENRPNMSSVVLMLNGEKELPKPSLPAFYTGIDDPSWSVSSSRNGKRYSANEVSVSLLEPR